MAVLGRTASRPVLGLGRFSLLLLVVLIIAPVQSQGQEVHLAPTLLRLQVGDKVALLEDPSGSLGVADILQAQQQKRFTPSNAAIPSFGFSSSAHWVRLTIVNQQSENRLLYLELDYPPLDLIDFYLAGADGIRHAQAGDSRPFALRPVKSRAAVFPFQVAAQSSQTCYLRVQTQGSLNLPLTLYSQEGYAKEISFSQLLYGTYYGIILAIIIYMGFLFVTLRDEVYLYYVGFMVSLLIFLQAKQLSRRWI